MQEIQSFEDACKALGIETALPIVDGLPAKHQKAITASYKLTIIAEALNKGWQLDWSNWSERKYYPWFDVTATKEQPSGSGLSFNDFDYTYSNANVGSRLCYRDADTARYAGEQFKALYEDLFLIPQS